MTIDNVVNLLPFVLTVCGSVLAGFQRLASVRSRRFDRVAQLSTAISELDPNDVDIRKIFEIERKRIVGILGSDSYKTSEGRWVIALMGLGTLLVLAAAVATANPQWIQAAPGLLIVGAVLAVPGVIGGFILGTK
ncbi:hypothetical protein ABIE21_003272 [Conyzicola nivalis]|uniref:Uncharacterized protein n=1 Tax=Conyzicola nivalis TaxID=1477021 RepID=A0ABV2QRQ5_9MICO